MTQVILSKYGDLLPLNRQQTIAVRGGFSLPRATQWGWTAAAQAMCAPVVEAMWKEAKRTAFVIATDATGARVRVSRKQRREDRERGGEDAAVSAEPYAQNRCDYWTLFVFIADRDHVVFRHHRDNNGEVLKQQLTGYRGNLLADAASVYNVLYEEHGMTENGCWSHARRPMHRALGSDPQRALEGLAIISQLFAVDRELRSEGHELADFTRRRAERSAPLLRMMDEWVALHAPKVDERSPLASALTYYTNQRAALHRFMADGRIRLDNNPCEQALRNHVLGAANWGFFEREKGLIAYTTFRSLIASCALHGLNPELYLEQLLRIVPHWPKRRTLELSPKYWSRTVARLDASWRRHLERPWESGVVHRAALVESDAQDDDDVGDDGAAPSERAPAATVLHAQSG
jgi:transposase